MYKLVRTVDDKHIDFQGILDGLYFPFYMEEARHSYLKEVAGIDIEKSHDNGLNFILVSINNLNFKKSIKKNDIITTTCMLQKITRTKFDFYQEMIVNDCVVANAIFTATCMPINGGRPFVPNSIKQLIKE